MDCYPIVLLILRSSNVMGTSALWGEMLKKTLKELGHLLIYLLLCSNHLHALHCLFCSYAITFWAAAPKGMKSCRTQGESVHLYVCLYVHLYIRPSPPQLATGRPNLAPRTIQTAFWSPQPASGKPKIAYSKLQQAFEMPQKALFSLPPVFYRTLSPSGPSLSIIASLD